MRELAAITVLLGDRIDGDRGLNLTCPQRLIDGRVIVEQVYGHRRKTAFLEVLVQFLDLALGIATDIGADGLTGQIVHLGDGLGCTDGR